MEREKSPTGEKLVQVEFKSTPYRWVVLASVMLSIVSGTLSVSTLSPVALQIQKTYGLNSITIVNLCAMSFSMCSAPMSYVSIWAYSKYEISTVLRIASFFQLIGMLVRDLTIWNDQFWPMLAGVLIQSMMLPFFLNVQAWIANRWFSDKQRALAMGLLSASIVFGNATSFTLTGAILEDATTDEQIKQSMHTVLKYQTYYVAGAFVFFQVFFRNKPNEPPSAVAMAPDQKMDLSVGLREIWTNKNLLILTAGFSSFIGMYFSLGIVINSQFFPFGQSPFDVSILGLLLLSSGVVGSAISGIILDKTAAYKRLILICTATAIPVFLLMGQNLVQAGNENILRLLCAIVGLLVIPVLPASLGLGIELTFPLPPVLINGSMLMLAQIQATIQCMTYSTVMDVDPTDYSTPEEENKARKFRAMICLGIYLFVILISFTCFAFVEEDLKRLRYTTASQLSLAKSEDEQTEKLLNFNESDSELLENQNERLLRQQN